MRRRPLATAAATLSALTALTACNGSPEAGQPNTTPTTTSATPKSSPTPTAPSTPTWSPEQQTAITAAKARYVTARAGVEAALSQPTKATSTTLAASGNGGAWARSVGEEINFRVENGWYQTGAAKVVAMTVRSVNLKLEQPEVRLTSCIDSAGVVLRYQTNGEPIPVEGDNGDRHQFQSRLVFAPGAGTGAKTWILVDEKDGGTC
ncbi:hypothetical protein [Kribbella sp. NPDC004875]|uniref:hypothetical protein n=1 Tax=Kribbella sp. NPDC004875 TaxID=3364107 RepID=UPI0036CB7ABB